MKSAELELVLHHQITDVWWSAVPEDDAFLLSKFAKAFHLQT